MNATIVWGQETNKMQAGLYYEGPTGRSSFDPGTKLVPCIRCLSEKGIDFLWIPPERERYRVSLLDERGSSVPRTAKGEGMGRPIPKRPTLKRRGGEYERFWLGPSKWPYTFQVFRPSDFFVISKPGRYRFEWEMRLLCHNSATNFQPIVLPPVALNIVAAQPDPPQ